MAKVIFEYDINQDAQNIFRVITTEPIFDKDNIKRVLGKLDADLIAKVKKENDANNQKIIIGDYLKDFYLKNKALIDSKIISFGEKWEKINQVYFERLSFLLNVKIEENISYKAYLTSAGSCPFNVSEKWFMVRITDEEVNNVAVHEIMHIEFIRAYGYFCKNLGLSPKQFGDLKEGLTVLLNEEMGDILARPDYGYEEHQLIRQKIKEIWHEKKDIRYLIEQMVKFL